MSRPVVARSHVTRYAAAFAICGVLTLAACGGGSDDDAGDGGAGVGETLTITSHDDFTFDPGAPSIAAGAVHLVHDNGGSLTHSLVIDSEDVRLVGNDDTDVELVAGDYDFYCDIPGHREAGMEGVLTVTP